MGEKKTVRISIAYLVELSQDEINADYGLLEEIASQISEDRNILSDIKNITLNWNDTSCLILDSNSLNCGRCAKCGQWTTDKEKPNAVEGLCYGAEVGGKLLCNECLPPSHKWAF